MTEKYFGVLLYPRSPNCYLATVSGGGVAIFARKSAAQEHQFRLKQSSDGKLKCRVIKVDCCYEMPR